MTVMILSSPDDVHAHAVMTALAAQDLHVELLDLSQFPTQLALSMAFEDGASRFTLRRTGGGTLDLSTVGAVWWRRPQPLKFPATLTDPAQQRFALSEATTTWQGLYQSMNAFWVNDPARDTAAQHKPWQLALAQEIGLKIPVTLMTNGPEEAREFWRHNEDRVVFKMFIALPEAWRETRLLRPENIAFAESVRLTPVIFQRFVEAVADVRVTIVGHEIFAASTDVRKLDYPVDFRMNPEARFEKHTLPPNLKDRLLRLTRCLGLEYGAIDLRLTPEGEYVFLEINPAGQFLWIEEATGQKIAAALAAHLANASATRQRYEVAEVFASSAFKEPAEAVVSRRAAGDRK